MSGLPPPPTIDDEDTSDVEFLGSSQNTRKRSVPEPQETPIFIKKRAIKVKPSIRKAEIREEREDEAPSEISIKGIAEKKNGDHGAVYMPAAPTTADLTAQHHQVTSDETETAAVETPTQQQTPKHATSPEIEIYIPPIDPASIPRSALVPPRSAHPLLLPCRSVYEYTRLNRIEEGTYGIVSRARCNTTGGIYALKKLKLEEEKAGFPITSLREVMALMTTGAHENVVGVREIVVGDSLDQ